MSKLNWKKVIGWGVAALVVIGVVGFNAWRTYQPQATKEKPNVLILAHTTGAGTASDALKKTLNRFKEQNTDLSFNWILVDTHAMPSEAVSALHQQLALHKIDLVVAFLDNVVEAILPIANQKNVFVMGLYCETQNVDALHNLKNIQYYSTKGSDIFAPMGRFLKQKASKIAVLYTADAYGDGGFKVLKDEYLDDEHQIVFSDSYALTEYKLRDLVQKTLSHNPEAIAVIGYGSGYENIFRLLKQYKYNGIVLSDSVNARLDAYNRLDGALEGVYLPFVKIIDQEKFDATNLHSYPDMLSYDALNYVDEAFRNGYVFSQEEFRKKGKYENILVTKFLKNGQSSTDMQMGVWKDGKVIPVTE